MAGDLSELSVFVTASSESDDETGTLAHAGGEGLDGLCFRPTDSTRASEEVTAQLRVQATLNVGRLDQNPGGEGGAYAQFAFQAGKENPTIGDFLLLKAQVEGTPFVEYDEIVEVPVVLGAWLPMILDGEASASSRLGAWFTGTVDYQVDVLRVLDANRVDVPIQEAFSALGVDYMGD